MGTVRSNDPARRQVFIFKALGFDVRIPVLVTGFFVASVGVAAVWLLTAPAEYIPALSGPGVYLLRAVVSVIVAVGGTILALRKLGRYITPATPLRFWLQCLVNDLNSRRSPRRGDAWVSIDPHVTHYQDSATDRSIIAIHMPAFTTTNQSRD